MIARITAWASRQRLALWRRTNPARARWMPLRVWRWLQPRRLAAIYILEGYITPGLSKVFWAATITAPTGPAATEINAGTELTPAVRGMPDAPRSGNVADDSDLSTRVDKQQRGTITLGAVTVQMKRSQATETQYAAIDEGDSGYLIVFRKGTAGATPAAADVCDVFTVDLNVKGPGTPGRNEVDFSNFEFINRDEPNYDVVCT